MCQVIAQLFQATFGEFDFEVLASASEPTVAYVLWFMHVVTSAIVLLNMLIGDILWQII